MFIRKVPGKFSFHFSKRRKKGSYLVLARREGSPPRVEPARSGSAGGRRATQTLIANNGDQKKADALCRLPCLARGVFAKRCRPGRSAVSSCLGLVPRGARLAAAGRHQQTNYTINELCTCKAQIDLDVFGAIACIVTFFELSLAIKRNGYSAN